MSLPSSVQQILEAGAAHYEITQRLVEVTPLIRNQGKVNEVTQLTKASLLKDDKGLVLVIVGATQILNLDAIKSVSGRPLRGLTPIELERFKKQHGFDQIPAIPQLLGLETYIDESVAQQSALMLDTGLKGQQLKIVQDEFDKLLSKASIGKLANQLNPPKEARGKDWYSFDLDEIHNAVNNFTSLRIRKRLEETFEIPPLPETAQRILQLRLDPNATTTDLADIVEMDASLSAQVMSWAASPYYRRPGNEVNSIQEVVVRVLGFDLVIHLSLGLALGQTLKVPKEGPNGYTPFWVQSVYCATCMEAVSKLIPSDQRPSSGLSYLAGLLHNFGFLILAHVFPPQFKILVETMEANPDVPCDLLENDILGISREQIAACLLKQWCLPEESIAAVRHQNMAHYTNDHFMYSNLLHLVTRVLRQHGVGDAPLEPVHDDLYKRLNLGKDEVNELIKDVVDNAEDLNQLAKRFTEAN